MFDPPFTIFSYKTRQKKKLQSTTITEEMLKPETRGVEYEDQD